MKRKNARRGRQREWTPYDDVLVHWLNENFGDHRDGSRTALAMALGMPQSTISRMTRGKRRIAAAELPIIERYFGRTAPTFTFDEHAKRHIKRTSPRRPARQLTIAPSQDGPFLPEEAAARLRVSIRTMRKLIKRGEIRGYPRGVGAVRPQLAIPLSEIEAYEARRVAITRDTSLPPTATSAASRSQQRRQMRERQRKLAS
jgi:excisionase family DNA binding protein